MQIKVSLIFHIGQQLLINSQQNLNCAVLESDGNSCAIAAAKLIIKQFGSVDITKTSLNTHSFEKIINWDAHQQAKDSYNYIRELEIYRNPFFYLWSRYFTTAPIWEIDDHTYYIIELTEQDLNFFCFNNRRELNKKHTIEQVILEGLHLKYNRTIIFLCVKDFDQGRYHAPKMYIDTVGLFNGIYRRKQERWLWYNVTQGSYPDEDTLKQTNVIIIPGSTSSAYDEKAWIRSLQNFILNVYENHTQIKIMGICFGFQLLAQAFGGIVVPCKNRIKHKGFYYYGNEKITIKNDFFQIECFKELTQIDSIIINKAHGDIVTKLPEKFINYGSSKTAHNEIFISEDLRIFGMQSHPEYTSQQILLFISGIQSSQGNKSFEDYYNDTNNKNFVKEKGDFLGLLMCHNFLQS
ncbi:unnamed protein product [Paramecium pentaurelia]|uniref:Glutamine amidotransferase domain-containing protein n=1 Tax=Paramecium pentaurelia TaxID=43138 RepID=A0A8S1T8J3_9CILI|nr:unnamed protein product [Paramecium pentaurelia]